MIDGAFQLIREQGHEALTVRNLASFLGCSTQPIMYQFPDTDILKDLDPELVKGALAGEHFDEYFFRDCKDPAIAELVRELKK